MRTTPTLLALALAATPLAAQDLPATSGPGRLSFDTVSRVAHLELDAGTTPRNGGLNFEGSIAGEVTLALPTGWSLTVRMINHDPNLPHSIATIAGTGPLPVQVSTPSLPGGATPDPATGTSPHDTAAMALSPPPGRYRLVCAVPGHALAGMWVWLDVSDTVRTPRLRQATTPPAR